MLDLVQLRSFVTVQQMGSFTFAAERLGLGQSTVSQHISKLEAAIGRRLLARDTHKVVLTPDGEALLGHARTLLSIEGQVQALFTAQRLRGTLRLGVSEDLVASRLPLVLEDFVRSHPSVDLELTVALSGLLYEMQDNGELDLVLAKRRLGDSRGRLVYREPLVWLARDPEHVLSLAALPLIAFPPPSVTRSIALEALERHRMPWRIVCTCGSLSGLTAAARAGMGVLVQPQSMSPSGLKEIGSLPQLEDVEFVLIPSKGADRALVSALSDDILNKVKGLR
ncbi:MULTISPECIES: LysR substrate-binding domain-containing protein [Mesorhizobium]|jgi:DNA-binding transcriptional LysR family regulator|uniref:LysR family transcriptional regulator n=1 Tax=Rhizobium loti TaxID=381 RepID=A0A6M7U1A9_RHILI|nr:MULTISPECIES: LysR substrate-binding domain-containing protein [Mesorhizobium]KRB24616.1 LysR family transcriptional regulator [Mesorhizobium sp. Root172]OBQ57786.1 LysR family transcriptional regulator [Mesorhizobium loti]QKC70128.1 LysR family transcriptional regulator [Mesorhizobium loti]QKC91990.1 LysR family transcriptional regulator [Mesorhizobium sp. NZP2234]